jgi:hypothetical protein
MLSKELICERNKFGANGTAYNNALKFALTSQGQVFEEAKAHSFA